MKAAFRRIALLTGVGLSAIAAGERADPSRSSDDLVTYGELRKLRRAGAI